jgi:hypothetical protein
MTPVERLLRKAMSARVAQRDTPLRNAGLARESRCEATTTGGTETATGGTGAEDGTGTAALSGTGLGAVPSSPLPSGVRHSVRSSPLPSGVRHSGGRAGSGSVATAFNCSGSAMSSASVGSSSAMGSSGGGTLRAAAGRGGGFDARAARGGGATDSGRGGRLVDGFVVGTLAGGWVGRVGVSRRPSPSASILRPMVVSTSLFLSRPMAASARTLRA